MSKNKDLNSDSDKNESPEINRISKDVELSLQEYRLVPISEVGKDIVSESYDFDIVDLVKFLFNSRKKVFRFAVAGAFFGVVVALLSPVEFNSGATLIPEISSTPNNGGSLLQRYGSLLGVSGVESGTEGNIPPQLYPQIVQSLPFQLELLNNEIEFVKYETTTTLYNFFDEVHTPSILNYIKVYTIGLPGIIRGLFAEKSDEIALPKGFERDSVIAMTKDQMEIVENLRDRISVSLNEETGVISLDVRMPDPNAAAEVAKVSIDLLKEYVKNYRTLKVEKDLEFAREQMNRAKDEFEAAQIRLAEFQDENISLSTARSRTQQQRLQSEYDLTFNVYNSLAQQVEQAKLKVQEQTPVVSIIQPVQIPVEKSSPRRAFIVISALLFSVFISISIQTFLFIKNQNVD